ncbi:MAG: ribonuclease HII [Candidatus Omnitrophica bacterium]|nr:ribonuclease HII [Candidatus Omnitrophota bacterium]
MLYYERKFKKKGFDYIIGVDEVGRGPLAGPVVAAAAALKDFSFGCRIDDSKKLSSLQRQEAFSVLVSKVIFGIGVVNEKLIDRINILEATRLAMQEAVSSVMQKLESKEKKSCFCLVDGQMKLDLALPFLSITKGDSRSLAIASASIIAKVVRDRIMGIYDRIVPDYGFIENKGYPTARHRQAIEKHGRCFLHRESFSCV